MAQVASPKIKRALVSVSNKKGITEFCSSLSNDFGVEIISTGGTLKTLIDSGIKAVEISQYTGFPEIMDGRVKTLHPLVHGGILSRREIDKKVMEENNIQEIDLVIVNLYPFIETITKEDSSLEEAIENIDIGGPSMVRSAAKNNLYTGVVVEPEDYQTILDEMKENDGSLKLKTRRNLAAKAFSHTANYDAAISDYLNKKQEKKPEYLFGKYQLKQELRYGENPHQSASFYIDTSKLLESGIASAKQLQGKELSYNNIADTDAAFECVKRFEEPACVIVKHANPCGVAMADKQKEAYLRAFMTDPTSAFGGIIAFNCNVDGETAEEINKQFAEIIIAPSFSEDALNIFDSKKNLRVLEIPNKAGSDDLDFKKIGGGFLIQTPDQIDFDINACEVVSELKPNQDQLNDMRFAWHVAKYVKSNAIIFCKDNMTLGVGAGQMSRVDSTRIAAIKAENANLDLSNSVVASDAFFPFRDGIDVLAKFGAKCVIQPGGSVRDDEVIEAANELGLVMLFTKVRHFKH